MEKNAELKGKKIAIIGLGASQIDYVIGVENSKQWDEVWGINSNLISNLQCRTGIKMNIEKHSPVKIKKVS